MSELIANCSGVRMPSEKSVTLHTLQAYEIGISIASDVTTCNWLPGAHAKDGE